MYRHLSILASLKQYTNLHAFFVYCCIITTNSTVFEYSSAFSVKVDILMGVILFSIPIDISMEYRVIPQYSSKIALYSLDGISLSNMHRE